MKSRFLYIIFAIVLMMLISPYIRHMGKGGHFFTTLIAAMIPLTSFYALTADRRRAMIILFIAIPFVILDSINMFITHRYVMIAGLGFAVILYGYIIVLLVKNLLSYRVITIGLIYCAIATYLLIGVMWAGIYGVLEGISPGSIAGISRTSDLMYFSFVTLTTVGFGDISPQTLISKRLAVFEAAMGGIYMAVIIALIVGRYTSAQVEKNIEKPNK